MYDETNIELGQVVKDEISGFQGVVTTIGAHISGCIRIGVKQIGAEEDVGKAAERFYFPGQLQVVESDTKWTDVDSDTETEFQLGELVTDRGTQFTGRIHIINYKLFNCPQACLYGQDGDADSHWNDVPMLKTEGNTIDVPAVEADSTSTGACEEDSRPQNLAK